MIATQKVLPHDMIVSLLRQYIRCWVATCQRVGAALDIGAGSGRDARALAAHGLNVTAVDHPPDFVLSGRRATSGIRWIDDRLPDLARICRVLAVLI